MNERQTWIFGLLAVGVALAVCAKSSSAAGPAVCTTCTVTVSNLKNQGVVHTGFVIGTAAGGTSALAPVEVSLDGGPYTAATGSTTWTFKLPTGGSTWKEGSAHTIAVRAKDAAGLPGAVTTLNVRKDVNQDVNGDGYADVVVGAIGAARGKFSVGEAYVFHSAGSAGVPSANDTAATTTLTGTAVSGNFGVSVALGDINGDGYADVVVGASGVSSGIGKAYVFHSAGSAGIRSADDTGAASTLTGTVKGGNFGRSVALGDVNGDGYADVVVGASAVSVGAGKTYVFHSAGGAGVASANDSAAATTLTGTADGNFGWSVALGDVNGDGYADVVVGARGGSSRLGKAYVFHSGGAAGVASAKDAAATTILSGTAKEGNFGISVALGDVNGDGYADVVVGAHQANRHGEVYVFHSAGSAGVRSANDTAAATTLRMAKGGAFGWSIALGDVNGDGYADVVVGAPDADSGEAVYVFHSTGSAGLRGAKDTAAATRLTTVSGGEFGSSVALGDVNGDGYADVVVGAAEPTNAGLGKAFVFHSTGGAGVRSANDRAAATTLTGTSTGGEFGFSVAP